MRAWIELVLFLLIALPITIIDVREYRIPDLLTFGGITAFFLLKLLWNEQPVWILVSEGAVGFGVFWLIWWVTRGQIGLGDAKYSAFIAVAAGFSTWFAALFIASVIGVMTAAVLIVLFKADRKTRIPFAPFLTVGAALSFLLMMTTSLRSFLPDFRM